MSDFEEYIKVNYPRDYDRQKRIYPDQSVEELYSEDYKVWQHQQTIIDNLKDELNNMEAYYIEKKKECEGLQKTNISLEAGLRKNSKNKQKLLGKNIELQKRIDEYEKLTTSIRNEFDDLG